MNSFTFKTRLQHPMSLRELKQFLIEQNEKVWDDKVLDFIANTGEIISLEGGPSHVEVQFIVENSLLKDLKGGPKNEILTYSVFNNVYMQNIEDAPESVSHFSANNCKLKHLTGIGRKYIKRCWKLDLIDNPFESNILGLVLIKNLQRLLINFDDPTEKKYAPLIDIMQKYKGTSEVLECQEELIENGYKQFAKL